MRMFVLPVVLFAAVTLTATAYGETTPGVFPEKVRIGQTGVFSGPVAEPGIQYRAGAQLYFDETNAQGGVYNRKIELVSYDDRFDPSVAAENTQRLIEDDQVFVMFGFIGTGATMGSYPKLREHRIPVVGVLSGADGLRTTDFDLLYHTRASYLAEIEKMVEHLKTMGTTQIALVYQDDPFGRAGLSSARNAFERQEVTPVIEAPIDMSALDNLRPVAAQVAERQPPAIIMITAGRASTAFISAYQEMGLYTQFFGVSVLSANDLIANLGDRAHGIVIAQVVPSPSRTANRLAREFRGVIERTGSSDDTHNSLEGYLSAKVFVEALRRAGPDLTREGFVAALSSFDNHDVGGMAINYARGSRLGSSFVDLSIVRNDGRLVH